MTRREEYIFPRSEPATVELDNLRQELALVRTHIKELSQTGGKPSDLALLSRRRLVARISELEKTSGSK